jgi:predicted  nucleic acid-binding Zn-ribbon protein
VGPGSFNVKRGWYEPMHKDLELLIKLHDLDIMIKEASEEQFASEEQDLGFVLKNRKSLLQARDSIRDQIPPETLSHYDKLFAKFGRALAPVNQGVCYGCFLQLPTIFVQESKENQGLEICPRCRRFLYWL